MADRVAVVQCLVGGNTMRTSARIAEAARNTVAKLLVELGTACSQYQDITLRNLNSRRIQVNECWAFCYCKQKHVTEEIAECKIAGDIWTWAAIDVDTKLVPCWVLGKRDAGAAQAFVSDLASRLADRVQLTSDELRACLTCVLNAFGISVEYAQLVKAYEQDLEDQRRPSSPGDLTADGFAITCGSGPKHIERQNLTVQAAMRRLTPLTNVFSKKAVNHAAAVSLHMMYHNFARVHQTRKTTPAVAASIADHVWSIEEIVSLLDPK